jgi:hypothetical protein
LRNAAGEARVGKLFTMTDALNQTTPALIGCSVMPYVIFSGGRKPPRFGSSTSRRGREQGKPLADKEEVGILEPRRQSMRKSDQFTALAPLI